MSEYSTAERAPELLQRRDVNISLLVRVAVVTLMIQLVVMVSVADRGIIGNLLDGFYWRSSGWSLFPIPLNPNWFGWIVLFWLVPLTPLELLVYLTFVANGIWIFWEIIGVAYIVYPWSTFLQSVVKRGKSIIVVRMEKSRLSTTSG